MRCKDCPIPPYFDYSENEELCRLFGYDNDDKHFKEFADGESGCIHRKATLEKWWEEHLKIMERN